MPTPLIDVVIPVFNAARTIEGSVASIQRQTISDIRIIVVNDGSTDATGSILAVLAAGDPRVQVVDLPHGGIVDALNVGVARCSAQYVARHDADDLAVPHRFETQIAYLEANADCIALSGAARHIDEGGSPIGTIARLPQPELAELSRIPAREPYLPQPFLMAVRSYLDAVGGYRHVHYAEDTDLCWRLQELGRLHNLDEVLGDYRVHAHSITGASVVNGRISALNSQLSALSAARRRSGRPDIAFPKDTLMECVAARNLAEIFRIGCRQLNVDEASWLRPALAGKLLDLAAYRPYELELGDCRFIRDALERRIAGVEPENRQQLNRMWSGTAARLASVGRLREALALSPPRLFHVVLLRLAYRMMATSVGRQVFRRLRGQNTYYK